MSRPTSRGRSRSIGLVAILLATAPLRAQADSPAPSSVPGWQEFVDSLQSLPDRMLARLPEERRGDPQIRQEVARLALESLASSALEALEGDGDAPKFLPAIGHVLNVGQPVGCSRMPARDLEQRLRELPQQVDFMALLFVDRVERMRRKGAKVTPEQRQQIVRERRRAWLERRYW